MKNPCNDPVVEAALSRRKWLSHSFNRGAQTIEEATVSARVMAESIASDGEYEAYEAMWNAREASRGPNENFEGPCTCCPRK